MPEKVQILLFPSSTVLISFAALGAAQAVTHTEVRLSLQALFIAMGIKDIVFGVTLYNYFNPKNQQDIKPALPPVLMDGHPIGKIVPIAPSRIFPSEHVAVNLEKRDPRIKQWATAIVYGREPMTQARWAGGKKPFSKPEYAAWMKQLLERGVVVPKYAKGNNGGFKPNRAQGLEYLKALADGREYLPLPQVDRSKSEYLWLGA